MIPGAPRGTFRFDGGPHDDASHARGKDVEAQDRQKIVADEFGSYVNHQRIGEPTR